MIDFFKTRCKESFPRLVHCEQSGSAILNGVVEMNVRRGISIVTAILTIKGLYTGKLGSPFF